MINKVGGKMFNYEDENDLYDLEQSEKLKIVKEEISKINNLNNLLYDSYKANDGYEVAERYLYASLLINKACWNIMKMFPD